MESKAVEGDNKIKIWKMGKKFLPPQRSEPQPPGHKADIKPMCQHAPLPLLFLSLHPWTNCPIIAFLTHNLFLYFLICNCVKVCKIKHTPMHFINIIGSLTQSLFLCAIVCVCVWASKMFFLPSFLPPPSLPLSLSPLSLLFSYIFSWRHYFFFIFFYLFSRHSHLPFLSFPVGNNSVYLNILPIFFV